jgi:transcriptional regulator with XRE-family HTH domain
MKINTSKIEKELKRLGWSKYRLAKKMKVRHQWVYFILSDSKNCTLRTIENIANALEMDPKDLII